jgi:ubiquinol-cytochrome c reductase cytochrome b subunit
LDDRTGYRQFLLPIRLRVLPDGPKWEYSTASCLLWLLVIEAVTGFLLMATYSPSITSAWASVHYIDESVSGNFIRALHHYTTNALIIMFAVHTIRVLLRAGFRPPHELVWITGLLMIPLMILWAVTGNPLAGTVKGMAQIEVEGNIIGSTPLVGPLVQRILIGGDEVGHLTLTHLYFLHVALLPLLVGGMLTIHIVQIYRHGLSMNRERRTSGTPLPYWPYQTIRNMLVLAAVLSVVAAIAWWLKAPLDAPADAQLPHTPRPEWYLLFLFELRRYFTGNLEFIATMVIPASALVLLLSMPLIDHRCSPRVSGAMRLLIVMIGVGGWCGLTLASVIRDRHDAEYQDSRAESAALGQRARELADRGEIPAEGAIALLRNDPRTQGPLLFAQHCATCHSHVDASGAGIKAQQPTAPNLHGFASRDWIAGLLDAERIAGPHYFGNTKFADGDMVDSIKEAYKNADGAEHLGELQGQLDKVAWALSAEARLPLQVAADQRDQPAIAEGVALLTGELSCTDCHRYRDQGELGSAPDLTGYGSREWLIGMMKNPQHERFYPGDRNDGMPAFAADSQHPENNVLSPRELDLLADWLRHDWYGSPESH